MMESPNEGQIRDFPCLHLLGVRYPPGARNYDFVLYFHRPGALRPGK